LIFIYSGIFSASADRYPIPSFYEEITGSTSPSHGLSKSFSEIIRGNVQSARQYNKDGILIFSFFLVQLIMRTATTLILAYRLMKKNVLIISDVIISILLFLYCFHNLIGFLAGNLL